MWAGLKILRVEAVREFFEGAAAAFGAGSAKFFAEPYEQGVEFIEKADVGWEVRLK
jgi:hypothetical protein